MDREEGANGYHSCEWVEKTSSASMVSFDDARGDNNFDKQYFFPHIDPKLENCKDEDYDGCFRRSEKKRQLSPDQVQFLEKSFDFNMSRMKEPPTSNGAE